jgi:hypothetical protein
MDGPRPVEVLAWVNGKLASRGRPTLTQLPPGGAPAALPDFRFYTHTFEVLEFPGMRVGKLPRSVQGHLDWLRGGTT